MWNKEFEFKRSRIVFGDCLEKMDGIPDGSIDMVCADLPYGMTAPKWDEILPADKLWEQYNRIIAPDGTIALFASQPFTAKLISSNEKDLVLDNASGSGTLAEACINTNRDFIIIEKNPADYEKGLNRIKKIFDKYGLNFSHLI